MATADAFKLSAESMFLQGMDALFCEGRKCLKNNQIPLRQRIRKIFIIIRRGQIGHQSLLNLRHPKQRQNRSNWAGALHERGESFYQCLCLTILFIFFKVGGSLLHWYQMEFTMN